VVATLPSKEIGPLQLRAHPVHDGFAVARATLPLEGHWQLRIEARRGEFDLFTGTLSVEIRKES
jgi:nitrogen fixation protein FixH